MYLLEIQREKLKKFFPEHKVDIEVCLSDSEVTFSVFLIKNAKENIYESFNKVEDFIIWVESQRKLTANNLICLGGFYA